MALQSMNLAFEREYSFDEQKWRYDFSFNHNEIQYILEYDGIQHFQFTEYFQATEEVFKEKQTRDVDKTKLAIKHNCKVIRIDYTQINNIEEHIKNGIDDKSNLYLSSPDMYEWLSKNI